MYSFVSPPLVAVPLYKLWNSSAFLSASRLLPLDVAYDLRALAVMATPGVERMEACLDDRRSTDAMTDNTIAGCRPRQWLNVVRSKASAIAAGDYRV